MKIEVKIGGKIQTFTENDIFFDSGRCVAVTTKHGYWSKNSVECDLELKEHELEKLDSKCDRFQVKSDNEGPRNLFKFRLKTYTTKSRKHRYRIANPPVMCELRKWLMLETGVEFWDCHLYRWSPSSAVYPSDLIELTAEEKAALK